MSQQPNVQVRQARRRLRFTYVNLACTLILLIVAALYSSWLRNREHEANLPLPALETVVVAVRTFHQQTGRFPESFRELDERVWKGARRAQISAGGKSLDAPASHYYYTLHSVSLPRASASKDKNAIKVALWGVPTGPRAQEAATHFWYVMPDRIERWMGPALTAENVSAVKTIPSEQQLALLVMTRQPPAETIPPPSRGIFSILGF
jgi:hypothetical protein